MLQPKMSRTTIRRGMHEMVTMRGRGEQRRAGCAVLDTAVHSTEGGNRNPHSNRNPNRNPETKPKKGQLLSAKAKEASYWST